MTEQPDEASLLFTNSALSLPPCERAHHNPDRTGAPSDTLLAVRTSMHVCRKSEIRT